MARFCLYLVSALFVSCLTLCQGGTVGSDNAASAAASPTPPVSTNESIKSSTSSDPPATSDLTSSPTTPPTTTPVTTPKTTTTQIPTTTTPVTTTSEKPEPPTTTTEAPTPGPVPPADQGTWYYNENNITCVVVQFAAQLNVTYTTTSGKAAHALVNVPKDAVVKGGSCLNNSQSLMMSWPNTSFDNSLELVFNLNSSSLQYSLQRLNVTLKAKQFPGALSNESMALSVASSEWSTEVKYSYSCSSPTTLNLSGKDSLVATLTLRKLQEEAFRTKPDTGFSAGRVCAADDIPDKVPIVVGCVLAGLVVAVLVAYLISRRRAVRGYLSM